MEAGYDYAVSFDIDCATEANGTILTTGENATFYLADPETGRLAFSRDGYLNKFNYKLPETGRVTIRIEGTNAETRLFVNNRHRETLRKRDAYSVGEPLNTMPDAPRSAEPGKNSQCTSPDTSAVMKIAQKSGRLP